MMTTYQCAQCDGTFEYAWSDGEAKAEAMVLWGENCFSTMDMAIICDDCNTALMEPAEPHPLSKRYGLGALSRDLETRERFKRPPLDWRDMNRPKRLN